LRTSGRSKDFSSPLGLDFLIKIIHDLIEEGKLLNIARETQMKIELNSADLKPEFQKGSAVVVDFAKFQELVQVAICAAGSATYVVGDQCLVIYSPAEEERRRYGFKAGEESVKAVLGVYEGYDLTGGGLPFGHDRVFHVKLSVGDETIVRNRDAGHDLVHMIETLGKPIGRRQALSPCHDYRGGGYKQEYLISSKLTCEKIKKEVPSK